MLNRTNNLAAGNFCQGAIHAEQNTPQMNILVHRSLLGTQTIVWKALHFIPYLKSANDVWIYTDAYLYHFLWSW